MATTFSGLPGAAPDSKTQLFLQMAVKPALKTCSTLLEMGQSSKFSYLICFRIMGAGPTSIQSVGGISGSVNNLANVI